MAKITCEGKSIEIPDGSPVKEACKKLGIGFGCEDGLCSACMTKVLEGEENLEPLNDKEKDMGLDKGYRLMCQCRIKKGQIKIFQE